MLRNVMFVYAGQHPNVDVGVEINQTFIEVEGVHFDPERGTIILELDLEALAKALQSP